MTAVWDTLSDVQADAVRATAERHLRDADELAAELAPLLTERPEPVALEASVPPVRFAGNFVAEPSWTLLGTTPEGFQVLARPAAESGSTVNAALTLPTEQEISA